MTILALEFSSARRSVALACNGVVLSEAVEHTSGRETHAFGLIEQVLAEAKLSRSAIEVLAVGLGPGSYTGIRTAIAIAQGWQLAAGVKLLGINSAETLSAQAQARQIFGRVNVAIDAQRNEFYLATWQISEAERAVISPLEIATAAELATRRTAGEILVGPEQTPPLFPQAAMVAQLATGRSDFSPGEALEPIYLRATHFIKVGVVRVVV